MTSEVETLKTNEFLQRRKLRLQQVREQSKDIAKKIRQRTKVEKLRQIVDIDAQKEKEYLERQEIFLRELEKLHAKRLGELGVGHENATKVRQENASVKTDLSKLRGKEAASELRRKKQEKLDEQKKLLDRKLQAREAANEISRDKSTIQGNKLAKSSTNRECNKSDNKTNDEAFIYKESNDEHDKDKNELITKNDMATQWDLDGLENEWEPKVPLLPLADDERNILKETVNDKTGSTSQQNKKLDLFAISDEMPSSLRGRLTNVSEEIIPVKPSLTLVTEHLQNRALNSRDSLHLGLTKRDDDLSSIKQTIMRTRTSKCKAKGSNVEKSNRQYSVGGSEISKKNSVTMYNHETRDIRDIVEDNEGMVVRHSVTEDDAYSQAMRETSSENAKSKYSKKKEQDMRSRVAVAKQNVDKEYKETMEFLNSLPKESNMKPIKQAYMDETQEQICKEQRQRKLQQEFNQIERECRKNSMNFKSRRIVDGRRSKSKSPITQFNNDDRIKSRDFQYSWMPVPESDGKLAIHTISNSVKSGKPSNTVKFSEVDSYHEYRTRHRHTPPTKENKPEKQPINGVVEFDSTQQSDNQSTDISTVSSNNSSAETVKAGKRGKSENDLSDAEKILIYKILDSKSAERKKLKKCSKSIKNTAKSLRSALSENINKSVGAENNVSQNIENIQNIQSVQDLKEGIYKKVNEGGDKFGSIYLTDHQKDDDMIEPTERDTRQERTCSCRKRLGKNEQRDQGTISYTGDTGDRLQSKGIPKMFQDCKFHFPDIFKRVENQNSSDQHLGATSSTSFRTATSEKVSKTVSSQGYIKLIDDGEHEAGKFYIGASGLLKNDAYEVVIQLRKKNGNKNQNDITTKDELFQSKTPQKNNDPTPTSPTSERKINITKQEDKNKEHHELTKSNQETLHKLDSETINNSSVPSHKSQPASLNTDQDEKNTIYNQKKNVSDKSVGTSFNMSNEIPCNFPKSPPISRPATSAYTQTTLNSPNSRPVLIHMSSSTSTAYMSPPEIVLPNFIKKGYYSTAYDIHRPIPIDIGNMRVGSGYVPCKCKQCIHNDSENGSEVKLLRKQGKKNDSFSDFKKVQNTDKNSKHKSESKHVRKRKNNKNASGTKNKNCARSRKNKKNLGQNNSVSNCWRARGSHTNKNNRISNININKRLRKSGLNPEIKNYVHKLLALSRESLRAMEVVNEECSSVTTPESSIINMPRNMKENKINVDNRVSLQQIKDALKERFLTESKQHQQINMKESDSLNKEMRLDKHSTTRVPKWKPLHKVKSLNISKNIYHYNLSEASRYRSHFTTTNRLTSSSSSTRNDSNHKQFSLEKRNSTKYSKQERDNISNIRSTCMQPNNFSNGLIQSRPVPNTFMTNAPEKVQTNIERNIRLKSKYSTNPVFKPEVEQKNDFSETHKETETPSTYSNFPQQKQSQQKLGSVSVVPQTHYQDPVNISTQTSRSIDSEINFVKVAEDKLQNMEKIADLTEKCTQRLSSLAKVLEDVRRNKSLAYSQISTTESASDSDHNSDKKSGARTTSKQNFNPNPPPEIQNFYDSKPLKPVVTQNENVSDLLDYVPMLVDIPKPDAYEIQSNLQSPENSHTAFTNLKQRGKPPPALSRINLKHEKDYVIPHELSTVLEVDSPMSVKLKSHSRNCKHTVISEKSVLNSYVNKKSKNEKIIHPIDYVSPDVLRFNLSKRQNKSSSEDSSEDSKLQMMDLKQFNEIMLKPFISIQDYAKQCGPGIIDEGSNLEELPKDSVVVNEELSSMHSDGSLPDVIAELLKRNVITEPFKYDSLSNANSTTVSSDSTLSLALTKIKQKKKEVILQNKENLTETTESLSISSNPDLEKAFQKLGLGWASSTLKKTKERLALSSSSNTSSSSLTKSKIKNINKQNIPAVVPDSFSTILNVTKRQVKEMVGDDNTKNAEQQTALTNSMTVKEFLTNELAKRITFANKSNRNDIAEEFVSLYETRMPNEIHKSFAKKITYTNNSNKNDSHEEFISLYETKVPDEIKLKSQTAPEERCNESANSGSNKITRTSTPVQVYKSMTYQSSSSSNVSNGLFTNADDLSSVKVTSNSVQNHSTSERDDLTIPNYSLRVKKAFSESSKSE